MRFSATLIALAAFVVAAFADSTSSLEPSITDPGNPANLINCPPKGGADACNLEKPCSRIRVNYGRTEGGHYIWYNYDITDIPTGVEIGVEDSCTDY
ncbi:hypothetical protein C8J55DRAFT_545075 [Lentinula edodes]|uniref:Uncharacterized protein n=1 Tax=Lentinula lateritia TaxID=40482 RepID=A0A9W8ZPG1_9AGAR|nr:hypothetical protein C8J55DRAFT_545075 [Lentinula edodes]